MRDRRLLPIAIRPGARPDDAAAALSAALDGTGPALVPVPDGPGGAAVLAMARPDVPLEQVAPPDRVALVVPTSGSTGEPKGALLAASALLASARATHERLAGPGQWLLALPLTHIAGLQVLVRSVLSSIEPATLDGSDGFDVDAFVQATSRMGTAPRYTALVPTQLRRLLSGQRSALDALASYDAVLVGGAALDGGLRTRAIEAGVRIVTTYGMTETCGGCVYDGTPLPGVHVRAAAGEPVRLGGPVVFSGYRLRPDLTAAALAHEDGVRWHRTSDLGRLDPGGRLHVLGRADDVIITGGENVEPGAVELALASHPGVREVVVIGVPDAEWGQRVVAVVVPSGAAPDLPGLRTHAGSTLPPYALPRRLVLVEQIPLLASGKPDRPALLRRPAAPSPDDRANPPDRHR